MKYKILGDRVKIFDSYMISKKEFSSALNEIRNAHPTCRLWHRSDNSIKMEWAAHNLAYLLNINKKMAADCDLNYEQNWYVKLMYFIIGTVAYLFIK